LSLHLKKVKGRHDARHTAVTLLIEQGVHIRVVNCDRWR
jgi:hypothetical protein